MSDIGAAADSSGEEQSVMRRKQWRITCVRALISSLFVPLLGAGCVDQKGDWTEEVDCLLSPCAAECNPDPCDERCVQECDLDCDPCSRACFMDDVAPDSCDDFCDPLCDPCFGDCVSCAGTCSARFGPAISELSCDAELLEVSEHGASRWALEFEMDGSEPSWLLSVLAGSLLDLVGVDLELPNGTILNLDSYDNFNLHQQQVSPGVLSLLMPSAPRYLPNLQAGMYRLTVDTEDEEPPCFRVISQDTRVEEGPRYLRLRVIGVGEHLGSVTEMQQNALLFEALSQAREHFLDADIELYVMEWLVLPDDLREEYGVIRDFESIRQLLELLPQPESMGGSAAVAINVALIQRFAGEHALHGVTGGLPGPVALHGSGSSGVIVSTSLLDRPYGVQQIGTVVAHELGHYLGLRHTTSLPFGGLDALDDTPECPVLTYMRDPLDCPDAENMMFPTFSRHHSKWWSEEQKQVMRWHPSVASRND